MYSSQMIKYSSRKLEDRINVKFGKGDIFLQNEITLLNQMIAGASSKIYSMDIQSSVSPM